MNYIFVIALLLSSINSFSQGVPPHPPKNLTAIGGDKKVDLSWDAPSTSDPTVIRYQVKRKVGSGYVQVGSDLPGTATSFTDTGLANGTRYHYNVFAINNSGYKASGVYGTPILDVVPNPPKNLSSSGGDHQVDLSWDAPSASDPRVLRYQVKRKVGSGYVQIGSDLPATATKFTETGLNNGVRYHYNVFALNQAGYRAAGVYGTPVADTVPNPPKNLTAVGGDRRVSLNWDAPSASDPRVVRYQVKRKVGSGYVQVGSDLPGTATNFTEAGLSDGTNYHYNVFAINNAGYKASGVYGFTKVPFTSLEPEVSSEQKLYKSNIQFSVKNMTAPINFSTDTGLSTNTDHLGVLFNPTGYLNDQNEVTLSIRDSKNQRITRKYSFTEPKNYNFVKVSSNYDRTCAINNLKQLYCWGKDEYKENGVTYEQHHLLDSEDVKMNTPHLSDVIDDVVDVSLGVDHTCAIKTDGKLFCWGKGTSGQLGSGNNSNNDTPKQVSVISERVINVSAGNNHTCAVTELGKPYCWGANDYGQLGDGTNVGKNIPTLVLGLSNVIKVSSSKNMFSACALTSTGEVHCWGQGTEGQLGVANASNYFSPVKVYNLSNIKDIAFGGTHACALHDSGKMSCWGSNEAGQLGNGNNQSFFIPQEIMNFSGVKSISANMFNTCAIKENSKLYCWGSGYKGKNGDGYEENRNSPVQVKNLDNVLGVSAGIRHVCAVEDGNVYCWGSSEKGQIGGGLVNNKANTLPVKVSEMNSVSGLFLGDMPGPYFSRSVACAIDQDGSVYCWGTHFLLSDNNEANLPTKLDFIDKVTDISYGYSASDREFTCFLTLDKSITCWSLNSSRPITKYSAYESEKISGKYKHTCFIVSDQKVRCFGKNNYGELGRGNTSSNYEDDAEYVSGLTSVVDVSAGEEHTCAVLKDSRLYCWGKNDQGQLGIGNKTSSSTVKHVSSLPKVRGVSSGYGYTCAVNDSGEVYCWGKNSSGQLGNGTTVESSTPVKVQGISGIVAEVKTSYQNTCARTFDWNVYCWGKDHSKTAIKKDDMSGANLIALEPSGGICVRKLDGKAYCWRTANNGNTTGNLNKNVREVKGFKGHSQP